MMFRFCSECLLVQTGLGKYVWTAVFRYTSQVMQRLQLYAFSQQIQLVPEGYLVRDCNNI